MRRGDTSQKRQQMGRNKASTRHVRHVEKGQMLVSTRGPGVEALSQVGHLSIGFFLEKKPAAPKFGNHAAEPPNASFCVLRPPAVRVEVRLLEHAVTCRA